MRTKCTKCERLSANQDHTLCVVHMTMQVADAYAKKIKASNKVSVLRAEQRRTNGRDKDGQAN